MLRRDGVAGRCGDAVRYPIWHHDGRERHRRGFNEVSIPTANNYERGRRCNLQRTNRKRREKNIYTYNKYTYILFLDYSPSNFPSLGSWEC